MYQSSSQQLNALNAKQGLGLGRPAVNVGSNLGRLEKEGRVSSGLSPTGDGGRAADDFRKSQQMNESAQLRRGLEKANAQHDMQEKAMRSELIQMAASNRAKMVGDMAQREVSQIGLGAQLQSALMQNRNSLMQALMK